MSGLIGDQQVVARWDEDLGELVLTGRVAGAAGCAPVVFGPVTVDVDVADPQVLVELAAPLARPDAPDAEVRSVLRSLLGSRVAAEVLMAVAAQPGRQHRLGEDVGELRGRFPTARRGTGRPDAGLHPGVGRLAVAALARHPSDGRPVPPAVEAAVLLDSLRGADALRATGRRLPRPSRHQLLDDALSVLSAVDPEDLSDAARRAFADALERAGGRLHRSGDVTLTVARFRPSASSGVVVRRAPRTRGRVADLAVSALRAAPDEAGDDGIVAAPVLRAPVPVPADALGGTVRARWFDRSHVEVEIGEPPPDSATWWVRALHDDVVVAAAVVHPGAPTVLVVPSAVAVVVDVTTDPRAPVPGTALAQSSLGFAAGANAARAERLGDGAAAAEHWRRCALAHERAGDLMRSQGALARVRGTQVRSVLGPLVVDRVLDG